MTTATIQPTNLTAGLSTIGPLTITVAWTTFQMTPLSSDWVEDGRTIAVEVQRSIAGTWCPWIGGTLHVGAMTPVGAFAGLGMAYDGWVGLIRVNIICSAPVNLGCVLELH